MTVEREELETVIYEKDGAIARVILNRPEKANTQSSQLVWDFDSALRRAEHDYDVKVVIIKANGSGFCAGHVMSGEAGTYPETEEAIERLEIPPVGPEERVSESELPAVLRNRVIKRAEEILAAEEPLPTGAERNTASAEVRSNDPRGVRSSDPRQDPDRFRTL